MRLHLSVIIPIYNEAPGLPETLTRFQKTLAACEAVTKFEIILVDDGSTDGAVKRFKPGPTVQILRHERNTGYGSALKTGIRKANYPVIVICDADGSYQIEDLPKLLAVLRPNTLVVADRTSIPYPEKRWLKWMLRRILETWLLLLTYRWIKDINSGFRVFTKERVEPFLPDLSDRFSFTTGQTLLWIYSGYPLKYVPTPYIHRKGVSKVRFVKDGWGVFKQTLRLTMLYQPLRLTAIAVALGLIFFAIGFR